MFEDIGSTAFSVAFRLFLLLGCCSAYDEGIPTRNSIVVAFFWRFGFAAIGGEFLTALLDCCFLGFDVADWGLLP